MKEGTYRMVPIKKLEIKDELKKIHQEHHLQMRKFLTEKNLLDEYYEWFEDTDILDDKHDDIIREIQEYKG